MNGTLIKVSRKCAINGMHKNRKNMDSHSLVSKQEMRIKSELIF